MRRWCWGLIALVGCTEDPLGAQWNALFRVDTLRQDPGCETPVTETEPPQPFLALAYGRDDYIELEVVTAYWCMNDTFESCFLQPLANAWLTSSSVDRVEGEFGEALQVAQGVCERFYQRIEAEQTPSGRLDLDVTVLNRELVEVSDTMNCLAELELGIGNVCDERLAIEADRVD